MHMILNSPGVVLALVLLATTAQAQICPNIKLNPPVPADGNIVGYAPVPDGTDRTAFLGDLETDGIFDLYTVPASGVSAPELFVLDTPRAQGLLGLPIYTADGARAVFRGDFDTEDVFELYSVPTSDGGATAVKLNGPLEGDVQQEFVIKPDGSQVVYLAEQDSSFVEELYVVPITGGASRRLNADLTSGDVEEDFKLSADGTFVVYRAAQDSNRREVYAVPIAGGAPVRLSGPQQPLGNVTDFAISPDGSTVVYRADELVDNRFELFQVPIAGGAPELVSGPEVEREVDDFLISPDSTRVVYLNERFVDNSFGSDLYSAPLAAGDPVRLNDPLPPGGFVTRFAFDPASSRVVFEGSAETAQLAEIFSVPIEGGTVTKLSGDLSTADGTRDFAIAPDGQRVVYGVDHDPAIGMDIFELLVVPITGGGSTSLAGPLPENREFRRLAFTPEGEGIVYSADLEAEEQFELFQVPLAGNLAQRRLNQPLAPGASVGAFLSPDFQFTSDGRYVLFMADQETVGVPEVWSAELFCDGLDDLIFEDGFEVDEEIAAGG